MSAPAAARHPVAASFRALLRAVAETFRGDAQALRTCRAEARKQFRAHASERDGARIARLVEDARDAAHFLRESVVQAQLNAQGNYAMQLKPQPGSGGVGGGGSSASGSPIAVQPAGSAAAGAANAAGGEEGGGAGCGKPGGCGCG
jgi:complex III assembly factor LYRM7